MAQVTEVHGGRFHCNDCGISWVGTWHGPKEKITCVQCSKVLYSEEISEMPGLVINENLNRTAAEITNDARRGVIET